MNDLPVILSDLIDDSGRNSTRISRSHALSGIDSSDAQVDMALANQSINDFIVHRQRVSSRLSDSLQQGGGHWIRFQSEKPGVFELVQLLKREKAAESIADATIVG